MSQSPKRDAADEVADDVDRVAVAADFVDADDVGMAQLGGGAGFAEELFLLLGRHAASPRNFDGHRAIELLVAGLPHAAEAADAEPLDQLEAAQLRKRRRHPRGLALIDQAEVAAAGAAGEIGKRRIDGDFGRLMAVWAADFEPTRTGLPTWKIVSG